MKESTSRNWPSTLPSTSESQGLGSRGKQGQDLVAKIFGQSLCPLDGSLEPQQGFALRPRAILAAGFHFRRNRLAFGWRDSAHGIVLGGEVGQPILDKARRPRMMPRAKMAAILGTGNLAGG